MCRSKRWIWNKYDNRPYLVDCGHCEACLQDKAQMRASKITKEFSIPGLTCFFLTLTYNNTDVPYILHDEINDFGDTGILPVRRGDKIISYLQPEDFISYGKECDVSLFARSRYPYLRKYVGSSKYGYINNRVGVLWNDDIVRFFKRLKKNLVCQFNYEDYFSYYYCGEYGETYFRPHFHALIFCNEKYSEVIRSAVVSAWKYSDLNKKSLDRFGNYRQGIEFARSPSHYVASYVNCSSSVPDLLRTSKPFRPKYKSSHGFATNFKFFSYEAIKEAFYRGSLEYPVRVYTNGVPTDSLAKIPKYAISRFFPFFKGINRLSSDELFHVLQRPSEIVQFKYKCNLEDEDIHKIIVQIQSKKARCFNEGYLSSLSDFPFIGSRIYSLLSSTSLKYSWKEVHSDFQVLDHFINLDDYIKARRQGKFNLLCNQLLSRSLRSCFGREFIYHPELILNPNDFIGNVGKHNQSVKLYYDKIKQRGVYDYYYSNLENKNLSIYGKCLSSA